jgi:hypothetical protein
MGRQITIVNKELSESIIKLPLGVVPPIAPVLVGEAWHRSLAGAADRRAMNGRTGSSLSPELQPVIRFE